jgi:hypothetical protein
VSFAPDAIVAATGAATRELQRQTQTIPYRAPKLTAAA